MQRAWLGFSILFLFLILSAGFWFSPHQASQIPTICFFKRLTHLDCPGCGLTRSFLSIPRGDIIGATKYNAAGPLLYFYFLLYLFQFLSRFLFKGEFFAWPKGFVSTGSLVFMFLLLGHWVLRVIKQWPSAHFNGALF